jgi:hypothetical protein
VGQSCVDSALRLFPRSSRKPDVLDSQGDRDVQQVHLEPIDVLVDIIIGYLEKGTAFLRAVGNRSFSLLSGVAGESTVNLILTVSVSRSVSWNIIDIIHSNWNDVTLLNFLLTRMRKGMEATMDIRKAGATMANPPLGLRTTKVTKQ